MTIADTQDPIVFLDSFPWIADAVATAETPDTWDLRDEPEVLYSIEHLCSWLGPFLPKPEYVAIAARELAGQERDGLSPLAYQPPAETLNDIHMVMTYLAMIGAALEVVITNDSTDATDAA